MEENTCIKPVDLHQNLIESQNLKDRNHSTATAMILNFQSVIHISLLMKPEAPGLVPLFNKAQCRVDTLTTIPWKCHVAELHSLKKLDELRWIGAALKN